MANTVLPSWAYIEEVAQSHNVKRVSVGGAPDCIRRSGVWLLLGGNFLTNEVSFIVLATFFKLLFSMIQILVLLDFCPEGNKKSLLEFFQEGKKG